MDDRTAFRNHLVIPNTGGRTLGQCLERWQTKNLIEPLDAVDADGAPRYRRLYFGLPRAHGKSVIAACEALTTLVLEPDMMIYLIGPNAQQVGEVQLRFVQGIVRDTEGLAETVQVFRDRIVAPDTGSEMHVVSQEFGSSLGLGGHGGFMVIADELWGWPDSARPLWEQIVEARIKTSRWRIITTTNAGWDEESICWGEREICRRSRDYWFFEPTKFLAKFVDRREIERLRAELPAHEAARALDNKWVSPADITITREMVRATVDRRGPSDGDRNGAHILALDVGHSVDPTAVVVAHVEFRPPGPAPDPPSSEGMRDENGKLLPSTPEQMAKWDEYEAAMEAWDGQAHLPIIVVDSITLLQGARGAEVQNTEIAQAVEDLRGRFRVTDILYDPNAGARGFSTMLGPKAIAMTPTQALRGQLGSALYYAVKDRRLSLWPDDYVETELTHLRFRQSQWGLEYREAKGHHDDVSTCIAMIVHHVSASGHWKPRREIYVTSVSAPPPRRLMA